jgi:nitrogen regulatory protein P-II 1
MKKVEAIIKPFKLEEVQAALQGAGFASMTVTEVRGCGHENGHQEMYRGHVYRVGFSPRLKLEVVVPDYSVDQVVTLIVTAARTGKSDAGKIFVSALGDAVRIRTGEHGEVAV